MLRSVHSLVLPALQARVVLLVNHVLSREPAAMQRLQRHDGRRLRIEAAAPAAWLPALPPIGLRITPAGLFELDDDATAAAPDLRLAIDAPDLGQLAAAVAGEALPRVQIDGDAALAGDMQWLVDNLRWDIEADLAGLMGPALAHQVARTGRAVAAALRAAASTPGRR